MMRAGLGILLAVTLSVAAWVFWPRADADEQVEHEETTQLVDKRTPSPKPTPERRTRRRPDRPDDHVLTPKSSKWVPFKTLLTRSDLDRDLTPRGRELALRELRKYMARLEREGLTKENLLRLGISPKNDAIDSDNRQHAPSNVDVTTSFKPSPTMPKVDPSVTMSVTRQLKSELGREPTSEEIAAEIRRRDARVAELNAKLAENHTKLAQLHKQGRFKDVRKLEGEINQLAYDQKQVGEKKTAYTPEQRAKLYWRYLVTSLNQRAENPESDHDHE